MHGDLNITRNVAGLNLVHHSLTDRSPDPLVELARLFRASRRGHTKSGRWAAIGHAFGVPEGCLFKLLCDIRRGCCRLVILTIVTTHHFGSPISDGSIQGAA